MKKLMMVFLVLLSGLTHAQEASDASLKLADEYFRLSGAEKMYSDPAQMAALMSEQVDRSIDAAANSVSPSQLQTLRIVLARVKPQLNALVAKTVVDARPEMIKAIADTYTNAELKALVAFHKTPLGQSVAEKNPLIARNMMAVTGPKMAAVMEQAQQMIMKAFQELVAAGANAPAASGTTGK